VLLASLVFALQATTVTPLSASTSNEYIGSQLRGIAAGTLATGAETGSLEDLVLHWDEANGEFEGASEEGWYVRPGQEPEPNDFMDALQEAYQGQGVAYNIYLRYEDRPGAVERRRLLYQGTPTDNAVTASRTITIYDDDVLTGTTTRVDDSATYFAPDRSPGSPDPPLFTVITVEVVVWRL
jgi:hypothetical protein